MKPFVTITKDKNCCVYIARDNDDNIIYIGSGSIGRPAGLMNDSHSANYDNQSELTVDVYGPYSKKESLIIETHIYEENKQSKYLVNVMTPLVKTDIRVVNQLLNKGFTQSQISREIGVSRQRISKVIKENSWQTVYLLL